MSKNTAKTLKVGLVFSFLLLLATHSWSQTQFGIKAGGNFSTIGKSNEPFEDPRFGIAAGVIMKKYLGEIGWFVSPEVIYSQEGSRREKLDFINVPVIFGFDFSETVNFHVGPQLGFVVGGDDTITDQFEDLNFSLVFGFDFYPTDRLIVGSRFSLGMTDMVDQEASPALFEAKPRGFQLYLAYLIKK